MNPEPAGHRSLRLSVSRPIRTGWARVGLLAVLLALSACQRGVDSSAVEFPEAPAGRLAIDYPLDETLFPPDIAAPTFVWTDDTGDVAQWQVLVQLDGQADLLRFPTTESEWRPT